jgi:hypothetical protein
MLQKILIAVGALIAVFLGVVATRSDAFHIERSETVAAPPDVVRAQVDDFHAWGSWSPWEKLDPNMQHSYEGPDHGVGSVTSWEGNDKVGKGRMTIESETAEKVEIKLEFMAPMEQTSKATFTFVPEGTGTKVTWAMDGNNNFMGKAFSMVMDMDKMVGGDFERGLSQLKSRSETEAQKRAAEAQAAAETARKAAEAQAAAATATAEAAPAP